MHSVEECDYMAEEIDKYTTKASSKTGARSYFFWKDDKSPTPATIKKIKRWVANERFLSFASAEYFVTRYAKIRAANTQIVHFNFRIAQKIFFSFLAECDDLQIAIQLFILKARQLGVSTVTALFFLHRILYVANTYAVMASVQVPQSQKLKNMIDTCQDNLPFWLRVGQTSTKVTEPRWTNGSRLSVQAGAQEVGIGQGDSPSCLIPSTLIRIQNGGLCRIDELTTGDVVITHSGDQALVKRVWKTIDAGKESRIIKIWGTTETLEVTPEHLIKTPTGWSEARNLQVGEYVTHPVRKIRRVLTKLTEEHRDYQGVKPEIMEVPLNYDWGYLAGFYLAEGHVKEKSNANETIFTIHDREVDARITSLRNVIPQRWTIKYRKHSAHGTMISLSCSWVARWLRKHFGRTTNKQVPDWVWSAGREFCEGILRGWMDGDGHIERTNNNMVGASICARIIFPMRDLIASLGLGWSSTYFEDAHVEFGMQKKPCWTLVLSGPTGARYRDMCGIQRFPMVAKDGRARHWKYSADGSSIELKIKSIEVGWNKEYWDIEVDHEDHSFVTEHCSVHNCLHISELGDYLNPKHTLDEGLFPACHQLPSLFMVLEGTGSMATTWQKESWELYSSGKGRFKAFFIPPACATDLYPPEAWLRQHPLPEDWEHKITDSTRKMRRRGELYVRSTDYLWKFLGQHWEMPKEFQWFWQCGYEEAVAKHAEREFLAANAVTPSDAFQSKDDPVFTQETINLVTEAREKSYAAYAITGRTILMGNENQPYEPNPEDVNQNESNIVLDWEGIDGNEYRWNLVPLRPFDDSTDAACFDKLLVFEEPDPGAEYAIAIDTAHGLNTPNEDRSALRVSRYGHNEEPDRIVASFNSLRVNSPQMARIAAAIAVLYGTDGNKNVISANPLLVKFIIEQVRKPGDECQHQLKIMGFLDHHIMHRYDSKGNIDPNKGTQEGWFTRTYTRSILLDRYVDAINTGWLVLNDPISIRQLALFVRKFDKGVGNSARMEHQQGQHDDGLFADALCWTGFHDTENSAKRIQSRWPLTKKVKDALDDTWCTQSSIVPGY